jgi:CheY-like chemotaxis protein
VKNLVELHGGSVRAYSEGVGRGSTFEVTLPALAEPAVVTRPHHVHPGSHRVLVVDDNPDALALLADALELRGYQVARAHDGPSALAAAAQVHPEVALLDIGLPVMDGYELARRLREQDGAVKLVAVTGYDQPGDFERTHRAGFSSHLVKPISLERVQQTIEQLVRCPAAEARAQMSASATSAS